MALTRNIMILWYSGVFYRASRVAIFPAAILHLIGKNFLSRSWNFQRAAALFL